MDPNGKLFVFLLLGLVFISYYLDEQFEEDKMGGYVVRMGGDNKCISNLGWKA
jgi:hypothetical protein